MPKSPQFTLWGVMPGGPTVPIAIVGGAFRTVNARMRERRAEGWTELEIREDRG